VELTLLLPMVLASLGAVVLYTLAVLAWLCYVGISAAPWHA